MFDLQHFYQFANNLRIDSKERGLIRLAPNLYEGQKTILRNIESGMKEGVHEYIILKCRQLGTSSMFLALDMYWLFTHQAMTGALITHDDKAKQQFRTTLQLYYEGLPSQWKREKPDDNRDQWVLGNGSRLQYRVAGTKKSPASAALGRSSALPYLHATEVAFWGDPEGLSALRASLAEKNPQRLLLWESTANGFNHYYDMWRDAKRSVSQRAIFVSWWSKDDYRVGRDTVEYRMYYGKVGRPTKEEREWIRDVKSLYGVEITDEQIAWYRWMAEEKQPIEDMRNQEFPHTEERAFVATGSKFFSGAKLSEAIKASEAKQPAARYQLKFVGDFMDTVIDEVGKRGGNLTVWQERVEGAAYAIGADPAYGSSPDSSANCVSVWRCYGNRIEQVAEFWQVDLTTRQCAWVIAFLAGYYKMCSVNCEVNGPGAAVLNELDNMKREKLLKHGRGPGLKEVMTHFREYLYRKYDSIYGAPSAKHTLSTANIKERYLNIFKDNFETGMLVVRSVELLNEMQDLAREDGDAPRAPSGYRDDRVIAAALACLLWNDQMRIGLIRRGHDWEATPVARTGRQQTPTEQTVQRLIRNYMIGAKALYDPKESAKSFQKTQVYIPPIKPGIVHGRPQ